MTDIVIAPKVQQCLWSAISSIPGCQMDAEVVAEESHNNEIQYRLAITGWSPSLHKLTMNWHSDWTPIAVRSDEKEVEYILEQFDLQLNIQKERAARSLNAKRAFPCEISKTKRSLYNNNADIQDLHLIHMDRFYLNNLQKIYPGDVYKLVYMGIACHLENLHMDLTSYNGDHECRHYYIDDRGHGITKSILTDHDGITKYHVRVNLEEGRDANGKSHYITGNNVFLRNVQLPQTMFVSMIGRPFGYLTDILPECNERKITGMRYYRDGLDVYLEEDNVMLGNFLEKLKCTS